MLVYMKMSKNSFPSMHNTSRKPITEEYEEFGLKMKEALDGRLDEDSINQGLEGFRPRISHPRIFWDFGDFRNPKS